MPILYNCRHSGDQYRITKFDSDMNPQASYLCTLQECECPAGVRPMCRHRDMLYKFLGREHVGDSWFFDYDRGGWVQMGQEWISETADIPEDVWNNPPKGVTTIVMDSPDKVADVHNAIAEALGEPEASLRPPSPTHIPRRF